MTDHHQACSDLTAPIRQDTNMTTHQDLIHQIEHGHGPHITADQLAQAKADDTHKAEQADQLAQAASDLATAQANATKAREAHDRKHQPIMEKMIEELQAAHADMAAAYPEFVTAQREYQQKHSIRQQKHHILRKYVSEQYGSDEDVFDTLTGEYRHNTYIRPFGGVAVNGHTVAVDGSTTPIND